MPKKNKTEEVSGEVVQKYGPKTVDVRFLFYRFRTIFYFFESTFRANAYFFDFTTYLSSENETLVFVSHVSLL